MLTGRRLAGRGSRSAPSSVIEPASAVSRPAMIRSSVVLPQPDGPKSVTNSPREMVRWTLSRTRVDPKDLQMPEAHNCWCFASCCAGGVETVCVVNGGHLRRKKDVVTESDHAGEIAALSRAGLSRAG